MIRYPNGEPPRELGKSTTKRPKAPSVQAANRGMDFENEINISNDFYRDHHLALITKRPTPINVVKVDYRHGARITDAYFETQSTTDYNGVYRGRYLDFEAKSSRINTSFPLHNITPHQIEHLERVIEQGGIAFFLISFSRLDEVYLFDAGELIPLYRQGNRKSIPYQTIRERGHLVAQGYLPRLHYLATVDEVYFHEKKR